MELRDAAETLRGLELRLENTGLDAKGGKDKGGKGEGGKEKGGCGKSGKDKGCEVQGPTASNLAVLRVRGALAIAEAAAAEAEAAVVPELEPLDVKLPPWYMPSFGPCISLVAVLVATALLLLGSHWSTAHSCKRAKSKLPS